MSADAMVILFLAVKNSSYKRLDKVLHSQTICFANELYCSKERVHKIFKRAK